MRRPLLLLAAAVTLGMCLAAGMGQALVWPAVCGIIGCGVLAAKLGLSHARFGYVLVAWFGLLGIVWFQLAQPINSILQAQVGQRVELTGQISQVRQYSERQVLTVRLLQDGAVKPDIREYFQVSLYGVAPGRYAYGQIITLAGKPELIPEGGNPGTFSYRDYLSRRHIYTQIRPWSNPKIIAAGGSLTGKLAEYLRRNTHTLASSVMGQREEGILRGILFGDTDDLAAADKDVFSTTGVLHAFAVSGSNVAFVLFLGLVSFKFLPTPLQLGLTALCLIFYAVLTGLQGPVLRALCMALVTLGGYALGRKGDGLNSLALAALVILSYDPHYLTDPGFQLSFAAAWGLIELVPQLSLGRRLTGMARELVLFPIAAQVATLPLLAYYFNQVSLIGIVANILVTWFLALILEIGLAGASLGLLVPALGRLLLAPLGYLIDATMWVLEIMAKLPGAALWVIRPPVGGVIAYYVCLLLWLKRKQWPDLVQKWQGFRLGNMLRRHSAAVSGALGLLVGLAVLTSIGFGVPDRHMLEVRFLDVGQGDSILISTPQGRVYLIDGGPRSTRFDAGKSIVVPYLLAHGIKQLDGVFMTHPHDDHDGGLLAVVETLPVKAFYQPPVVYTQESSGLWPELQQQLTIAKIPRTVLQAGAQLNLDAGVNLQVLGPVSMLTGSHSDFNNNCLVMSVTYGGQSVLLTGDMELAALQLLNGRIGQNYSVVKVPHHGSKYGLDRDFWDKLNPSLAVISVGKNNFGQPTPEVINYWRQRGIPVLRTDIDGMVDVKTDGARLQIYTGRQEKLASPAAK